MAESVVQNEKRDLTILQSVEELSVSLAAYVAKLSGAAIKERGVFSVVLSGGSLIDELRKLTEAPYPDSVDWKNWRVFWVDERVVPKTDPDSNYKLATDGLLSKVSVNPDYVYAINDTLSAEDAARDYEVRIRELVNSKALDVSKDGGYPKFDLMLLGMGPDGHIASLFPHHHLIDEKVKWVASIKDSPKPPPQRITFTFPLINSAANVVMVITGASLADTCKGIWRGASSWFTASTDGLPKRWKISLACRQRGCFKDQMVSVNPDYVYAINDALSAEDAARDYEVRIRELVNSKVLDVLKDGGYPKFDLMLLEMGPDGHIASLFPHHHLIDEKVKWVASIKDSPKPPPQRITFTFPLINSAANVVMVITGASLAETLAKVFGEELPHGSLPAQMVSPKDGKLVWLADKEAASKIKW